MFYAQVRTEPGFMEQVPAKTQPWWVLREDGSLVIAVADREDGNAETWVALFAPKHWLSVVIVEKDPTEEAEELPF